MGDKGKYLKSGRTISEGSNYISLGVRETPSKSTGTKEVAEIRVGSHFKTEGITIETRVIVDHADAIPKFGRDKTRIKRNWEIK